jgi:hypothetical protein
LEPHDRIIEIACIVTERNLEPVDEGISYPIKTDKAVLDAMGEWCTNQHRGTGLTKECLNAKHSMREVEQLVLDYVRARMPESGKALLAGSSVHVDKRWLLKDMPRLVRLESRKQGLVSCLAYSTLTSITAFAMSRRSKVPFDLRLTSQQAHRLAELMIRWDPTFLDRRRADQQKKPADKGTAHRFVALSKSYTTENLAQSFGRHQVVD